MTVLSSDISSVHNSQESLKWGSLSSWVVTYWSLLQTEKELGEKQGPRPLSCQTFSIQASSMGHIKPQYGVLYNEDHREPLDSMTGEVLGRAQNVSSPTA